MTGIDFVSFSLLWQWIFFVKLYFKLRILVLKKAEISKFGKNRAWNTFSGSEKKSSEIDN